MSRPPSGGCRGSRTKTGRSHRVPLSRRALEVLEEARGGDWRRRPRSSGSRRSRRGPLANGVWRALLRRLGIDATMHGFRSSFRDWCGGDRGCRERWRRPVSLTRSAIRLKPRTLDPTCWNAGAKSWRRGPSTAWSGRSTPEYGRPKFRHGPGRARLPPSLPAGIISDGSNPPPDGPEIGPEKGEPVEPHQAARQGGCSRHEPAASVRSVRCPAEALRRESSRRNTIQGKDILGVSSKEDDWKRSGRETGKTGCFGFPVLERIPVRPGRPAKTAEGNEESRGPGAPDCSGARLPARWRVGFFAPGSSRRSRRPPAARERHRTRDSGPAQGAQRLMPAANLVD